MSILALLLISFNYEKPRMNLPHEIEIQDGVTTAWSSQDEL